MKTVKVQLLKDHIHAEVKRLEGEVIEVGTHLVDFLVRHGVIDPKKLPADLRPAPDASAPPAAPAKGDGAKNAGNGPTKE